MELEFPRIGGVLRRVWVVLMGARFCGLARRWLG